MTASEVPQRPYFPGLHGLRFFAASAVVFYHGELFKMRLGLSNILYHNPFIANIGQMAVNFFFVLSGFLITSLLMHEIKATGGVSVKAFYWRRVLRIWPPYYICLALSMWLLPMLPLYANFPGKPNDGSGVSILFYLLLLPNFAPLFSGITSGINHLWSIGVEEQFYLIWPWLIKKYRNFIVPIITILGLFVAAKIILRGLLYCEVVELSNAKEVSNFISSIRIQCMAIGALGAWAIEKKWRVVDIIFSAKWQFLNCALILYLLVSNTQISTINDEVYCCSFLLIILNVSHNPKSFIKLSWKGFKTIGDISYGMYVYHMIVIYGICTLCLKKEYSASIVNTILQQALFLGTTMIVSSISYHVIEKRVMRFKNRFSKKNLSSA